MTVGTVGGAATVPWGAIAELWGTVVGDAVDGWLCVAAPRPGLVVVAVLTEEEPDREATGADRRVGATPDVGRPGAPTPGGGDVVDVGAGWGVVVGGAAGCGDVAGAGLGAGVAVDAGARPKKIAFPLLSTATQYSPDTYDTAFRFPSRSRSTGADHVAPSNVT